LDVMVGMCSVPPRRFVGTGESRRMTCEDDACVPERQ
jgi:hypothetical protein